MIVGISDYTELYIGCHTGPQIQASNKDEKNEYKKTVGQIEPMFVLSDSEQSIPFTIYFIGSS